MPGFDEHNKIDIYCVGAVAIPSILWYGITQKQIALDVLYFAIPSAIFSTFWLSPDLDQPKNSSIHFWILPPIKLWWRIYAKLFKHRGISHIPIIGSMTRLIWIDLIIIPIMYLYKFNHIFDVISYQYEFIILNFKLCIIIFSGIDIPSIVHLLIDLTRTKVKRSKNKYYA